MRNFHFKKRRKGKKFVLSKESNYIKTERLKNPDLFVSINLGLSKKNIIGPTYTKKNEDITGWAMNMEIVLFDMNASKEQIEFSKRLAVADINLYNEYVLKVLDVYSKWKKDIEVLLKLEKEIQLSVRELEREEGRIVHLKYRSRKYKNNIEVIKKIFNGISEKIEEEDKYERNYINRFIQLVKETEYHRDEFEKKMNLLRKNFSFLFVNHNGFVHNVFVK